MTTIIRSAGDVRKDDNIIILMGPTHSGKSRLIDTLSQNTKWSASFSGDKLCSTTQEVQAVRIKSTLSGPPGDIVLVDTPGFDDTMRPDFHTLEIIANWLTETYGRGIKLNGILYLHRITDKRMSGSPYRNLRMLGQLCGSEPARRLIFVTTMWDMVDTKRGETTETQLRDDYFKPMLDLGADTARSRNTPESAWEIILKLLKQPEQKVTLIQEEMVDIQKELIETKAAEVVMSDLQKVLAAHKQTIEALKKAAEKADNQEMVTHLTEQRAEIQKQLEETYNEVRKLKIPFLRRLKMFFKSKPKQSGVELGAK